MDSRILRTALSALFVFVLALVAAVVAYTGKPLVRTGEAATVPPAQDVTRIESRLSQLEQRFYSMETSIRGLEQQQRLSSITSGRTVRDPEISLLRNEVEALRQRLAEVECGIVKMDERTLTPAAKQARRKSASVADDPCRLNADSPLRFSTRP
jgi:TolA-binding protein